MLLRRVRPLLFGRAAGDRQVCSWVEKRLDDTLPLAGKHGKPEIQDQNQYTVDSEPYICSYSQLCKDIIVH